MFRNTGSILPGMVVEDIQAQKIFKFIANEDSQSLL